MAVRHRVAPWLGPGERSPSIPRRPRSRSGGTVPSGPQTVTFDTTAATVRSLRTNRVSMLPHLSSQPTIRAWSFNEHGQSRNGRRKRSAAAPIGIVHRWLRTTPNRPVRREKSGLSQSLTRGNTRGLAVCLGFGCASVLSVSRAVAASSSTNTQPGCSSRPRSRWLFEFANAARSYLLEASFVRLSEVPSGEAARPEVLRRNHVDLRCEEHDPRHE